MRPPSNGSDWLTIVTLASLPSRITRSLRWHRSSGASREMKGGFQIAGDVADTRRVKRIGLRGSGATGIQHIANVVKR